jgi:hypothetical protein
VSSWIFLLIHGACVGQSSTDQVKLVLSRPFPAEAETTRRELLAAGQPAISVIGDAIRSEPQATHLRLAFLVDVLLSFDSPKAYEVLADLLSDSRAFLRGHVVQRLGRKKIECAVPRLIDRLSDHSEFAQEVSTDPYRAKPILVSDAAVTALSAITCVILEGSGSVPSSRIKFQQWWEQNNKRLSCWQ